MTFHINNEFGEEREDITMIGIKQNIDTILPYNTPIGSTTDLTRPHVSYGRSISDGDVSCARYSVLESYPGIVLIDEFDPESGYIRGRFDLGFVKSNESNCIRPEPDTVILSDGVFEIDGLSTFN